MVRIEYYITERIPDPDGDVSFESFHEVRNAVVSACKLHGPTGPMGLFPFGASKGLRHRLTEWARTADPDPVYFVVDDQYNSERYQYVQCSDPEYFTQVWILELMSALSEFPGWGIGISNIPNAYVLVFADKLMVTGPCFENVADLPSLATIARAALSNKDTLEVETRWGSCKDFFFEKDYLICVVDHEDGTTGNITIDRENVKSVFRNPFTNNWTFSLKDGLILTLPDEQTFTKIRDWYQSVAE